MQELIRTNDLVLISFVDSVLKAEGIGLLVLDSHSSVIDGSIGMVPRRLMVADDDLPQARRLLTEAGLGHELREKDAGLWP
ncbi:DUF2007 domain-containing protein [Zavarzinia aquatilis]|uniref:DUF2007 domain-containing protein n=1 Tax=Zavarzinia aquatilis TaxID=2211142 RepID=A0A317EDJ6_9PROT|nr:DUF2007 domain-containing protein [Zavarzinia aquatilis]PWR24344.1 DUF2007 domain-containing protein [Zavarzinia aquatilis]